MADRGSLPVDNMAKFAGRGASGFLRMAGQSQL
jgi:hypothetical protein